MEKMRNRKLYFILINFFVSIIVLVLYSASNAKGFPHLFVPGYFGSTLSMLVMVVFPPVVNIKDGKKLMIPDFIIYIITVLGLFLLFLALFVW